MILEKLYAIKNYNFVSFYTMCCLEEKICTYLNNGILLPKLFWPTVRKNCSGDREEILKFAEGQEFSKNLISLKQFVRTVKGQNNFW